MTTGKWPAPQTGCLCACLHFFVIHFFKFLFFLLYNLCIRKTLDQCSAPDSKWTLFRYLMTIQIRVLNTDHPVSGFYKNVLKRQIAQIYFPTANLSIGCYIFFKYTNALFFSKPPYFLTFQRKKIIEISDRVQKQTGSGSLSILKCQAGSG